MRYGAIPILLAASVILGAAGVQPAEYSAGEALLPDFNSFVMMRTDRERLTVVSIDEAADALKDYDVVFVGELHDHIANHLAEMALLRAIHGRAPQLALSMEQFERDRQSTVDDYLAGKIGEETLTSGLGWSNYAEAYRPLVEYAKDHHLPVIAANAPQKIVRCVAREGVSFLSALPALRRKLVAADLHTEDGPYKQKFWKFMEDNAAHGGPADASKKAKDERAEKSFAAQVTRDDTMAESIANFLRDRPGYRVMHVTGSFHVEENLGTMERLKIRLPNLKIALVLPLGVKPGEAAEVKLSDAKGADFAILLRREPEPYVTDKERKAAESGQTAKFRAVQSNGCKR